MDELLEQIRAAVADGASAEQKGAGVLACRAILAALETDPGRPMTIPSAPAAHPLAGIDPGQALDLLIAKLTAVASERDQATATATASAPTTPGFRVALVDPPRRPAAPRTPRRRGP